MPGLWVRHRRWIMSVALTGTAGFIDAVGYMILFHIYTANMSGNTITFGSNVAFAKWDLALHAALPIGCFIVGLGLCAFLMEWMTRARWRNRLAVVFMLEFGCLAAFLVIGLLTLGWRYPGRLPDLSVFTFLTILAAGAMGLQNASLTHVGALNVTTTHVTGTLLKFVESFMRYLFWLYDHTIGRFPRRWATVLRVTPRKPDWQAAGLMGTMFIAYFVGAVIGAFWLSKWGLTALIGPLAVVGLFIVSDLIWPTFSPGVRTARR
jgi:uncharacterized membrane protein YoaK (UPF0700 family)